MKIVAIYDTKNGGIELFTTITGAAKEIGCSSKTIDRNIDKGTLIRKSYLVYRCKLNKMKAHGRTGFK